MTEVSKVKNLLQNTVSDITEKKKPEEGRVTQEVEKQTGKVPSMVWLGLAVGSMAVSAGIELFAKKKEIGNFVGLWAPSFLLMGIYNKLVKEEYQQKA
jgi:hypothetical protein